MRQPRSWVRCLVVALAASACGQTADVVGDRNNVPPPPEDTGWKTDFEACATEREEAALVPTSLFLAVDRSGSMFEPADGSTTGTTTGTVTKWDIATSAFTSFFTDPASSTLDVALRLWPTSSDGCDNVSCDAVACGVPQVTLDSVGNPTHQQALIDAFVDAVDEGGGTPMHAALDGAVRWATAEKAAAPAEQVAILFVTDGEPNGCDEDIASIAGLAATAAAAGVPVYAVGIEGSNEAQIDQIAAAGATGTGYFVGSANAEADLLAALVDIQAQVVSCRFAFPTESGGEPLSPDLVRLEYTVEGEVVTVARVIDEAACSPEGWYLDDPEDPSTLTLCPATCTELQGIDTVAIEIDVGCECVTDDDCPGDDVCTEEGCVAPCEGKECGGLTGDGVTIAGRMAVQGGALSCGTAGGTASLVLLLAAFGAARVRRVRP